MTLAQINSITAINSSRIHSPIHGPIVTIDVATAASAVVESQAHHALRSRTPSAKATAVRMIVLPADHHGTSGSVKEHRAASAKGDCATGHNQIGDCLAATEGRRQGQRCSNRHAERRENMIRIPIRCRIPNARSPPPPPAAVDNPATLINQAVSVLNRKSAIEASGPATLRQRINPNHPAKTVARTSAAIPNAFPKRLVSAGNAEGYKKTAANAHAANAMIPVIARPIWYCRGASVSGAPKSVGTVTTAEVTGRQPHQTTDRGGDRVHLQQSHQHGIRPSPPR